MKSRIKLPVLSLTVLSIAFLSSFGLTSEAWAICSNKCQTGWNACNAWCSDHNKTSNSLNKCLFKCAAYWDSGKNPQSFTVGGLGTTAPPPNYVPGQVTPLPVQ